MFKTKTKLSTRIMSIFMSLLMAASMLTVLMSVQPTEEVSAANDYGLADNIQDGAILHCFDWKYNDIKAELQNIAEATLSLSECPHPAGSPVHPRRNRSCLRLTIIKSYLRSPSCT